MDQNLAVDKRLVKSKHRSGICQYIKNEPVKFGIKLRVIADSRNGYICDFNAEGNSHGLGYDTMMKLSKTFLNTEYHIFFDNFYKSSKLVCLIKINHHVGLSLKIERDFLFQ